MLAQLSSLVIRGSVLLAGLLSNVLLARWLGVAHFGEYVLLASVLLLPSQALGTTNLQLLTRAVGRMPADCMQIRFLGLGALLAWNLAVILTLAGGLLLCMKRGWLVIDAANHHHLLVLCLSTAFLMATCGAQQGILRGLGLTSLSEYPVIVGRAVLGLVGLVLLAGGSWLSVPRALAIQPVTLLLIVLFYFWILKHQVTGAQSVGSGLPRSRDPSASYLTVLIVSSLAPLTAILGVFGAGILGDRIDVANLRVAESLAMLVGLPQVWANVAVSPRFAHFWAENNIRSMQDEYAKNAREAFLMAALIALLLLLFGNPLVAFLYGPSFANSLTSVLLPLTLGHLISAYAGSSGQLLIMAGCARWALLSQILGVAAAVIMMQMLFAEFGLSGIASATSLGIIITNLAARTFVRLRLRIALPLWLFSRNLAAD